MSWVQYVRLRTYACFQLCMPLVSGCVNCALINAVPKRVSCYTDVPLLALELGVRSTQVIYILAAVERTPNSSANSWNVVSTEAISLRIDILAR